MVLTATNHTEITQGVRIRGRMLDEYADILSASALNFLAMLQRRFGTRSERLLEQRQTIQQQINSGWLPYFNEETEDIRNREWTIAPIPTDLQNRRVEITGPVDRKMIINALNSGANAYMADFEDSSSPTWDNMVSGQLNLRDAVAGTIEYIDNTKNKVYQLNDTTAVLIVRPRGWHLLEEHLLIDDQPMSASLFDFGLYFFHNAKKLLEKGSGPYFYLPKLENRHEAALWNDVFIAAQEALGLSIGTIKATVLIETILAAFEIDEILYSLKDHIVALNCGRWDYIFSFIKKFSHSPNFVLPERTQVTMTRHFMRSYSLLTIKTCHRRGALAMGGMAAQIPIKSDPEANKLALAKVRADKEREATDGHDGTWVAHPALVSLAKEVFDSKMKDLNQLSVLREDVQVTPQDLLDVPDGTITESGVRNNIRVGILYISSWLEGSGCVPLYNLMEDAATAEICRAQLWQWFHHHAKLDDGRNMDQALFLSLLNEETAALRQENLNNLATFDKAVDLFLRLVTADEFEEFLTKSAYRQIVEFVD